MQMTTHNKSMSLLKSDTLQFQRIRQRKKIIIRFGFINMNNIYMLCTQITLVVHLIKLAILYSVRCWKVVNKLVSRIGAS